MALKTGVSWLPALLLWGCACFTPQKGYNVAHGYFVSDDEFSSHAGAHDPQTSNQFYSSTNPDSISPMDEMQAMAHQRAHYENQWDVGPVTSPSEEMVQSEIDSEFLVDSSAPSVQISEHGSYGYQQPFGQLVKQHPQKNAVEGISFPTIKDLKLFINRMKSSFLTPGSDVRRYFQTAQQIMDNEVASNAQNTRRQADSDYRSDPTPDGGGEKVWSEPMNVVFQQNQYGANYQMPSESLSVADPFDSTASLISTSVYDSKDSGPDSALDPRHHLAATEHYGGFGNGDISGENHDVFSSAPEVRNENVQPPSYMIPDQIMSDSFPVNRSVSHDSSEVSNVAAQTSENDIQQQPNTSPGADSLTGHQKPAGTETATDLQSEELDEATPTSVPSTPKAPFLSSYVRSFYVPSPKTQLHIPNNLPQKRERPAPSFQVYQPTIGKNSKDINHAPTVHLPVSSDSVSSSSVPPQSSSAPVAVQTSNLYDIPVKLSSSAHGSSRQDGYLGGQANTEMTHLSKQKLVSVIQEPEQTTDNNLISISGDLDPAHSGTSSQVGVDYPSFNSQTHLTPASDEAFPMLAVNEVMPRNFIKTVIPNRFPISDMRGIRKPLSSFLAPQRHAGSLNGGFVRPMRAGFPQTFIQQAKAQRFPANMNKEPRNMAHWPPKSKISDSTSGSVFWRAGSRPKRLPLQMGSNKSLYTHVAQSTSGYIRGKVSLSKIHYTPYRPDEGKTGEDNWESAPRQHEYNNAMAHNVKE